MRKNLMIKRLGIVLFLFAIFGMVQAKRPTPSPEPSLVVVDSVTVDWANQRLVVRGSGFEDSTSFQLGGSGALVTQGVTSNQLEIPFSETMAAEVISQGNYSLAVNGSVQLSVYFASQVIIPGASDCPCKTEWDIYRGLPSPGGFAGLTPHCAEESDSGDFVTVQFEDEWYPGITNYWVLWTGWDASSGTGYCELLIDGPDRSLDSKDQFDACAAYLKNNFNWAGVGDQCSF